VADEDELLVFLNLEEGGGEAVGVGMDIEDIEDGGLAHARGVFVALGEGVELVSLFGADEEADIDPADLL